MGGFLARWDETWAASNVSPKTRERWKQLAILQVAPRLGSVQLQRIKPAHYAELLRSGGVGGKPLATRTVGHVHRLLRRALGHAVTWGLLAQNQAAAVRPTRLPRRSRSPTRRRSPRCSGICPSRTICSTPSPRATWRRARGAANCAPVLEGLRRRRRQGADRAIPGNDQGGLADQEPQDETWAPASTVEELRAHWKAQQEHRLAQGSTPDDLIFAMPDGSPYQPNTLSRGLATRQGGRGPADQPAPSASPSRFEPDCGRYRHLDDQPPVGACKRLDYPAVYGHLYPNTDDRAAQVIEAMFARYGRNGGGDPVAKPLFVPTLFGRRCR